MIAGNYKYYEEKNQVRLGYSMHVYICLSCSVCDGVSSGDYVIPVHWGRLCLRQTPQPLYYLMSKNKKMYLCIFCC